MEFNIKDQYRMMIECATDGQNTVMYDEFGNPNIMVWVCKDTYENVCNRGDAETAKKTGPLPAFITEGKEIDGFWISKYSNCRGSGGVPVSFPDTFPYTGWNFTEAKNLCRKKGKGWHIMTNFEYMAIVCNHFNRAQEGPWSGNNVGDTTTSTSCIVTGISNKAGIIKSGSGGIVTTHDFSTAGIYDLFGNTWEFCDGWKQDTKTGNVWSHGQSMDELMNLPFSDKYVMSPFQFNCLSNDAKQLCIDDSDDDPHIPTTNTGFTMYQVPLSVVKLNSGDFGASKDVRKYEAIAMGIIPPDADTTTIDNWDIKNVKPICKFALNSKVKAGEEYVRIIRGGDTNLGAHPLTYDSLYRDSDHYTCISCRSVYIGEV